MTDLTQKILSLDVEAASELNHANAVSMKVKREADLRAEQQMEEVHQLFEKQKHREATELAKNIKEDRERAINNLKKNMENFDKEVEIDILVEHLVTVVKDRICR